MTRKKYYGYFFESWKSDHPPKHIHIFDRNKNFLGRFDIEHDLPIGNWQPSRKLLKIIRDIKGEFE